MMYTKLYESLSKAKKDDSPWEHHTFGQALTQAQVEEIRNAVIPRGGILHDGTRSGYKEGVAKQNHQLREYITIDNRYKYPEMVNLIRELQSIPIDPNKPEDVDTKASDHAYDALRYLIMSRPQTPSAYSEMREIKRFAPSDPTFGY